MTGNSNNPDPRRDLQDVVEDEPESKHGKQGKAVHGGEQAGPNADDGGRTIAPQKGNPRADDRRPN